MQLTNYTLNIIHIFVIAPFLLYIALNHKTIDEKYFNFLFNITVLMVPYHAYRWYTKTRA